MGSSAGCQHLRSGGGRSLARLACCPARLLLALLPLPRIFSGSLGSVCPAVGGTRQPHWAQALGTQAKASRGGGQRGQLPGNRLLEGSRVTQAFLRPSTGAGTTAGRALPSMASVGCAGSLTSHPSGLRLCVCVHLMQNLLIRNWAGLVGNGKYTLTNK